MRTLITTEILESLFCAIAAENVLKLCTWFRTALRLKMASSAYTQSNAHKRFYKRFYCSMVPIYPLVLYENQDYLPIIWYVVAMCFSVYDTQ